MKNSLTNCYIYDFLIKEENYDAHFFNIVSLYLLIVTWYLSLLIWNMLEGLVSLY